MCNQIDAGLDIWAELLKVHDKKRALRGVKLLDEMREVLAQTAPETCCGIREAGRAIDGQLRCWVCGRVVVG